MSVDNTPAHDATIATIDLLVVLIPKGTKRKRGQLLDRLRSSRYRQTPNYHKRVKAHAISVSILASTLDSSLIWRIRKNKILSGRFFLYVFKLLCYHRHVG